QARMTYQGKNPYTDALALEAVRLLGVYLPRAVANGRDVEARERVHLASLLAGLAFSNAGLGAVHALQLPIGALTRTPHGLGNGVLLPYVMDANLHARQREFFI